MAYWVYILRSKKDGKLYTGSTGNLMERLKRHNEGRERSRRKRAPFELVYFEEFNNRSEALRREYHLKSLEGGPEKRKLIGNFPKENLAKFDGL